MPRGDCKPAAAYVNLLANMSLRFFHPSNWSRYSRMYQGDPDGLRQHKRIILLSQFSLFGTVIGVLHSLEDLVDGLLFMPMMDFMMACGIFIFYLLNESGKHRIAKIGLVAFLNIFFFIYSSLAPRELGIYLYYFPWVGLAAVVFETKEYLARMSFIGLSILLLLTLFVTDFSALGSFQAEAVDLSRSFIINLVSAILVLTLFIGFMTTINEQSEQKLMELAEEISVQNDNLEKVNRELDRFFYSATHDLKVPLMDIKGAINSGLKELKDPDAIQYFLTLRERADKLDTFLKDIIDYSRNTQTGLRLEPVSMSKMIDEIFDNFQFYKGAERIRFIKEASLDDMVMIDRFRLMLVMNNIVSNSIKYQKADTTNQFIQIRSSYSEGILAISVIDNGQGIEPDLVPKIFNMFFRGTDQSKGSGLGLYIVKETVEKMNGKIEVESAPGVGTTLHIRIPAEQHPAESELPRPNVNSPSAA